MTIGAQQYIVAEIQRYLCSANNQQHQESVEGRGAGGAPARRPLMDPKPSTKLNSQIQSAVAPPVG